MHKKGVMKAETKIWKIFFATAPQVPEKKSDLPETRKSLSATLN
jgi:hypothetical protein